MGFIYSFFNQPAIIIGLIAFVGLVALKKPFSKILVGTFKTIIGFLLLSNGGTIISNALNTLGPAFESAFGIRGVIPSNEAVIGAAQNIFGTEMALIMFFGLCVNIIIARFSKLKYIFLSGHHILFMSAILSAVLGTIGFDGIELVIVGSLFLGAIMTLSPAMVQPFYRKVTGTDDIAMGHFNGVIYVLGALISKWVGNKKKSTEEINVPEQLSFIRDNTITTSIVMMLIYIVTFLFADPELMQEISDGNNIIMFAVMQAFTFTVGFVVVLQGVRMMLAEIVPAFKGISEKIVPNATPALDVPVIFSYAPNAVLVGFISATVGAFVAFLIIPFIGLPVIIPALVNLFFIGAGGGVLANSTGGLRGTVIGCFFNGVLQIFLPAFLLPLLGQLGFANSTFADSDFASVGIILGRVGQSFDKVGIYALLVIVILFFVVHSVLKKPSKVASTECE